MSGLTAKTCVPCRGGIPPLNRIEAETLLKETPGWTLSEDASRIERTFKHKDFITAMSFVQKVGALAEKEGHHPDICLGWGYSRITLYTHKIYGLHENDFIVAAKINEIY